MRIGTRVEGHYSYGGAPFQVVDKFTGVSLGDVHAATSEEVAEAVSAALKAFTERPMSAHFRRELLNRVSLEIKAQSKELVDLIVAETGFTVADAENEVERACLTAALCAEEAGRLVGDTVSFGASASYQSRLGFTTRSPIGIVGAITPFNSPLNTVLHKIGPALAAGNAVILKPSGLTPFTADRLVQIFEASGLPSGFLSVLHCADGKAGEMLVERPEVQFFTFTGSTRVGRLIQQAAGLRRTQLELGSIASVIVCESADLNRAIPRIVSASFRKAGQVCTSVQRLYVQRGLVEEFTSKLLAATASMKSGDPRQPDVKVGPMISAQAALRMEAAVRDAQAKGARVLCGGARDGSLFMPTVLASVEAGMSVVDDEVFAPVVSISAYDELKDAVVAANSTPYGLSAGVFTRDMDQGLFAARTLRFGSVHINETSSARADGMPFGGLKDSGFGREGPRYAIREMTEERLVTFNPPDA